MIFMTKRTLKRRKKTSKTKGGGYGRSRQKKNLMTMNIMGHTKQNMTVGELSIVLLHHHLECT